MDLVLHLRGFIAVADELSVSEAAAELGIDQPLLSRRLRALERHLAVELLDRSRRRIALTADGVALLPRARQLVEQADHSLQAQLMYDSDKYTVDEIAETFRVARSTMYKQLAAQHTGHDCVLVVYRNTRTRKVDAYNSRRYGETGASEDVQLEADRKWWPIAANRENRVKAIVYVVDGIVTRVRAVVPGKKWKRDDRRYADVPLTAPLTELEIAQQLPTIGLALGDERPHVRGKIREYLPL